MQCRCSKCEGRQTLARRLATYIRPPACRHCGSRKWREDLWRVKHERGPKAACNCHKQVMRGGGYWFTHRRGSKLCIHHPKFSAAVMQEWHAARG